MTQFRPPLGVLLAGVAFSSLSFAQTSNFSWSQVDGAALAEAPIVQALPSHWIGQGPTHKIRVDASDVLALEQLDNSDVVLRHYDYASFLVFVIDGTKLDADALRATGFDVRDEYNLVVFNGLVLDGSEPERLLGGLPSELRLSTRTDAMPVDAGLYVIQFDGPPQDAWLTELDSFGAKRVHHMPMNAYVVQVAPSQVGALQQFADGAEHVQHMGTYEPAFRIQESLRPLIERAADEPVSVTVQLVNRPGIRSAIATIDAVSTTPTNARVVAQYVNVEATLLPRDFGRLAALSDVFQIEPLGEITRLDEVQGQITAGNLSGNVPSGTGYLAWVTSMGFNATQFGSFSVNVVDDATSLTGHGDLPNARVDFGQNPTNQSTTQGGHGFLNAHIVGGFNDSTGSAFNDANGYNYGLGIAPWAHVGATAIFGSTGSSPTAWENTAYAQGARISSNSWGFQTSSGGAVADYNASSQEYDGIVRDAQGGVGGNQELMVVFAAGNNGSGSNTVSSPATAKNVLTVGASENVRQTGTDGCAIPNSGANSANDIISFSSRGPVNSSGGDGRWKPEIVAPGTHIEAGVPQSNYNGSSVCNQFWPAGQTLYGWSSGTSHSTPAVAGVSALVYQWFLNEGLSAPSPAMNKAFIVTTGDYMNGVGANDTLPSNSQGMGRVNLAGAFNGTSPSLDDQGSVLSSTGATFNTTGTIANSGEAFRVVLSWTDAAGPTSGAPWVNDLDLEVTVGGTTYRGNNFSGAFSTSGGSADTRNNTESVFLPAGTSGAYSVTVRASSIAGDGVPGNGDGTDQDFALVVTNAGPVGPVNPTANFSGGPTSGTAPLLVNFGDLSSAGVTSWDWNFGDGSTSTQQHPSHTFVNAGDYTVSLTVTDSVGSGSITKTDFITATAPAVPGISDGSFEGQSAGTTPGAPWTIEFGTGHVVNPAGGTNSDNGMPTHGSQWTEISATSTNGGTPPSNPGGLTNPPVGGAGISQTFSYGAGQTTLSFDAAFMRNEGANQATFNDWMSVDITDGSTWQNLYYADTFTATPSTSAKNGLPMTAIGNVSVNLATLFPGSSTSTSFTITALAANASDSVQASPGYVDNFALTGSTPGPVAGFSGTPTSGTSPLNVSFSDSSTGSVSSYSWNFGDGTSSSSQNPSHLYTSAGNYTVTLSVTGPGGSDGLTRNNYIQVTAPVTPPTAGFSANPTSGVAPLAVNFTDTSSGEVTSWSWNFGDGATSTAANPSHSYTSAGTYTVTLTATGPGGSDGETLTNLISVSNPPTGGKLYYMSFYGSTAVPGFGTVQDEDIVTYDAVNDTWALYFDGSDVGLASTDINAFTVRADGSILMSFNSSNFSVAGLTGGPSGTNVEDSDVILFTPSSLGSSTSGSFSFYLDGSDVGLTSNAEDIDAMHENADGSLSISSLGSVSVPGLSTKRDEDVITISLSSTGSSTSGTWSMTFDGSDVGFSSSSSEDLDAISFDAGDLLFSTQGSFSASGAAGADEDAGRFSGSFGESTSGSASLELDLSALGISTSEDIDGICYR